MICYFMFKLLNTGVGGSTLQTNIFLGWILGHTILADLGALKCLYITFIRYILGWKI